MNAMLEEVRRIGIEAGQKILGFYDGDMGVTFKEDASPLTLADQAAHNHIAAELGKAFPNIPVISEEGQIPDAEARRDMPRFFLVDPLDGTKEFIKRNGEFTVNIALIDNDAPVLGVVVIPTQDRVYDAVVGGGSRVSVAGSAPTPIHAGAGYDLKQLRVSMSRSHPSGQLDTFLKSFEGIQPRPLGSSLKFCYIAEGLVDFYPRFGPLCEWDTAAAHVILEQAGGVVACLDGQPLRYNKDVMKHYGFVAASSQPLLDALFERLPEVEVIDDRA